MVHCCTIFKCTLGETQPFSRETVLEEASELPRVSVAGTFVSGLLFCEHDELIDLAGLPVE